jgi:hypothetical protein
MAKNHGLEFAGAVLRPHSLLMDRNKEKAEEVLKVAKRAGFQLLKEGRISREVLDTISQPLIPEENFRQMFNDLYKSMRAR